METKENTPVEHELDVTETQAYHDLVEACSDCIPDGTFTLKEFARDAGIPDTTARKRLNSQVKRGTLGTKLATVDGFRQRIYWFVDS